MKFVEYYKWIDDAITMMISQLMPASSNSAELLRNMVESHILERGLLSIWNSNYQVSENMKVPFNELTSFPKKDNIIKANIKKLVNKLIL